MKRRFKIIVEQHAAGYVAYPLGLKGIVVGQGDTSEKAVCIDHELVAFGRRRAA